MAYVASARSTRRLSAIVGSVLLVAACGGAVTSPIASPSSAPVASPTASTPTAAASPSVASTRTVDSALGPIDIPAEPQRIVSLLPPATLALLDLGAPVVGSGSYEVGQDPLFYDRRAAPADVDVPAELPSIGLFYEPNLEAIRALDPDLIVARAVDVEGSNYLDDLQSIAPTFVYKTEGVTYGGAWRQAYEKLADVANKQDEAAAKLAAFDERVAVIKERLGDRIGSSSVSLVRLYDTNAVIEFNDTVGTSVFDALGLHRPQQQDTLQPNEYGQYEVSLENLDLLDGDVVLVSVADESPEVLAQYAENPVWRSLEAFKAGRVHVVGDHFQEGTIWQANKVLDDFQNFLLR